MQTSTKPESVLRCARETSKSRFASPTGRTTMTKLLLLLMMVGLWSGCGGDSPTESSKEIAKWTKTFGSGGGNSVQQTVDGGFIVTGRDGDIDVLLLKTDGQGNI